MKNYYKLTTGKPAIVSGQFDKPEGFTEYDPENPPQELIDAQEPPPTISLIEITVPTDLVTSPRLGGNGDPELMELLVEARSVGANAVTHPDRGVTCITVYESLLAKLPDETKELLAPYINAETT